MTDILLVKRFMRLFLGFDKGHGYGDPTKTKFVAEKNKNEYDRANHGVGWRWRPAEIDDFIAHLEGRMALGIGPLLPDGMCWRLELDLDKIDGEAYNFDYEEIMRRLTESGIPFVANRTKSGGIRVIIFFKTPIEAELARRGAQILSARLGFAGNEIFPKQDKLESEKDAPSWTFLPYGPTADIFAEQCGMSDNGKPLTLLEYLNKAEKSLMTREEFLAIIGTEDSIKAEARKNGKKKNTSGLWSAEESEEDTIRTMFCDGPCCLWTIAQNRCTHMQNNFLCNVITFIKRKYPDNWEQALDWVNMYVLKPAGSLERLQQLKKDMRNKDYEYRCNDEPINSHCNPFACRKMKFGVGSGAESAQHRELGMTIWNSIPQKFIVNVGEHRISFGEEILNLKQYRAKCLSHGVAFPSMMSQGDWDKILRQALEEATVVEPPELFRTSADEVGMIQRYIGMHIPWGVRQGGQDYLDGKLGKDVRIKVEHNRVYFKWDKLEAYCIRVFNLRRKEMDALKLFLTDKGDKTTRGEGRDFYRSCWALPLDMFDKYVIEQWLSGNKEEE